MNYQNYLQKILSWVSSGGIKVIVILFIAWLANRIIKMIISRAINIFIEKSDEVLKNGAVKEQRIGTLSKVFNSTLSVVIWTIAILTILPELGVNVTPLLAGAGLAGLAIGMGAKNIIQDYLAGLFILLEDQYRVGDEVELDGIKGKVKDLDLRRTVIKDPSGTIHYIPNGQVKTASNFSRK